MAEADQDLIGEIARRRRILLAEDDPLLVMSDILDAKLKPFAAAMLEATQKITAGLEPMSEADMNRLIRSTVSATKLYNAQADRRTLRLWQAGAGAALLAGLVLGLVGGYWYAGGFGQWCGVGQGAYQGKWVCSWSQPLK